MSIRAPIRVPRVKNPTKGKKGGEKWLKPRKKEGKKGEKMHYHAS